ncbi:HAMP domain-containing sensor histidine kinase [uncultured Clostridium sp.]|uniref:HAMP domain-containing sensor histidine kinase n=1 Tax=uncultured Clostridium sp. TaxID=59620 RepID=UPI0025D58490|nr:HAMP domain-containing sensor histidine kinase [uncultured Clostridium sp.]
MKNKTTLQRRMVYIIIISSIITIIIASLLINKTMSNKFNEYIEQVGENSNKKIVESIEAEYNKYQVLDERVGEALYRDAYMGNYYLTLINKNGEVVWKMDENDIIALSEEKASKKDLGVYYSPKYQLVSGDKEVGYVIIGRYSSLLTSEREVNFKSSINRNVIASGFMAILIAIALAIIESRQLSKPIEELSKTAEEISKGNFSVRSYEFSNIREIEALRESINNLGESLYNGEVVRKRLVSDVSHELRTPLNILQNNLEAMIDGIIPISTEKLEIINDEVVRFSKLLDNLKVLKSFEEHSIKMNLKHLDLNKILRSTCENFRLSFEDREVSLEYIEEGKAVIIGDEVKIREVLVNILSNCLKYVRPKGVVKVHLKELTDTIEVIVWDNGMGINKNDLKFVFERLYRADKSRNSDGLGLGLTICKSIMESHGGKIFLDSKENHWTEVKLVFNKIK